MFPYYKVLRAAINTLDLHDFPPTHDVFNLCVTKGEKESLLKYRVENKKKLFTFGSETKSLINLEYIGLCSKSYSVQCLDLETGNMSQKLGCKGVCRLMTDLKHEIFVKFLMGNKLQMMSKYKHICMKRQRLFFKYGAKRAFSKYYDKRYLLPCGNVSLSYANPEILIHQEVENVVNDLIAKIEENE